MLKKFKPKGEFGRNVMTLMTGTVAAQAIPIAASPFLTRLYTPEDFGLFALYAAIAGTFSTIVTGRYELAVMHPENDEEAKSIVIVSLLVSSLFCVFLALIICFLNQEIAIFFKHPRIGEWLFFLPLTLIITGWYQTYSYWLNRKNDYRQMSLNKVVQTVSLTFGQIIEGCVKAGADGLLIGHITGWLLSLLSISKSVNFKAENFKTGNVKYIALKYRVYPLLQAPSSFLNTASNQAPVLFLTEAYMTSIAGFYNLTLKVLTAPAAVISKSIGQVYFQRITEIARVSPHQLVTEIFKTTKRLSAIALIVFLPVTLYGKEMFYFVFGPAWEEAGFYAQLLSPAIAIKFIVSPVSTIFLATGSVSQGSRWQVLYFTTSFLMLFWAIKFDITHFLWIYVAHELCLYSLYFFMMLNAAKTFAKRNIIKL